MPERGLARYMEERRSTALANLRFSVGLWRWSPLVILIWPLMLSIWMRADIDNIYVHTGFLWIMGGVVPSTLGLGLFAFRFLGASYPLRLKAAGREIQHNLVEHGLLLRVLDPERSQELPHLFGTVLTGALHPFSTDDRSTVRGRLDALTLNYLQCCADLQLPATMAGRVEGRTLPSLVTVVLADTLDLDPALSQALTDVNEGKSRGSTGDW